MFKKLSKRLGDNGLLLTGILATNIFNFAFNAFTGRALSPADYGFLALINTFWTLLLVGSGALMRVVSYRIAKTGIQNTAGISEYATARRVTHRIAAGLALGWLAASPLIAHFFHAPDVLGVAAFAPMLWLGLMSSVDRGFVQGSLHLVQTGWLLLSEAAAKLVLAVAFIATGQGNLAYLSLPLSVLIAFATARYATNRLLPPQPQDAPAAPFAWQFLGANVLAGLAAMAFLSVDLLLAKHYLDPAQAGEYAMLSLVGKMVYFFGSMVTMFMLTHLGNAEREGRNPRRIFWRVYGLTAGLLTLGCIALGPLGPIIVPMLFGANSLAIVGLLGPYALGIGLFTLANVIVTYRLAKKHYIFSWLSVAFAAAMAIQIALRHQSVGEIAGAVWTTGALSFIALTAADLWTEHHRRAKRFIAQPTKHLTRLLGLLTRPDQADATPGLKRILILNWRDIRHAQAGGAELYVHELGRRWHLMGHEVTVFCGNDGLSPRYEVIDGIRIIRRGGFYTVYLWAFLYYVSRLRHTHDVIIDCHNGIPFFSPLYARKPVYCVVHHVHQDVFFKYLNKPMAIFAAFLEKYLMPAAYRHCRFMTVSNSSKQAMVKQLSIPEAKIQIIPNGVDLSRLTPGQKSTTPTVLCVGRLKAYKSVDVLIRAFAQVLRRQPNARLIIAGTGDDESRLRQITAELGVTGAVTFTGRVSDEEKIRLLQEAWVFVNPSYAEGWGITTIEANACGTPVIASDVPGLRDSVKFPSAGYLVPYGNVDAFARKITLVLTNETKRLRMSHQANTWAQNFDWQTSAVNFIEVIS